jgi:hypothetical protein
MNHYLGQPNTNVTRAEPTKARPRAETRRAPHGAGRVLLRIARAIPIYHLAAGLLSLAHLYFLRLRVMFFSSAADFLIRLVVPCLTQPAI